MTQAFCQRQRSDKAFDEFYVRVVTQAKDLQISEPKLPTYLKPLKRFGGSDPHQFDESEEFVLPCSSCCGVSFDQISDIMGNVMLKNLRQLKSRCLRKVLTFLMLYIWHYHKSR